MTKPDIVPKYGSRNLSTRQGKIQYIVIHYTAGVTSKNGTALANAIYYGGGDRQASADFFVDDETIVQYNPSLTRSNSWAVGGSRKVSKAGGRLHGTVKNSNSISIEMCSYNDAGKVTYANDGHWHVTEAVYQRTVALTRWLMEEYGIDADHVIRHYDVTGKLCPGMVGWNEDSGDVSAWAKFKADIAQPCEKGVEEMTIDELIESMTPEQCYTLQLKANRYAATLAAPTDDWAKPYYDAIDSGVTDGTRPWATGTRLEIAMMIQKAKSK